MPYHESPPPLNRAAAAERSSSIHSLSNASPLDSTTHKALSHKPHKAHTAGHGRLPHSRNPSYGKNLNKLTKIVDEGSNTKAHPKQRDRTPSTSPSTHIKRNGSTVSLPRVGSKASVKRNSSNVSLKRNGSSTQVGKNARPTTPLRRSKDYGKEPGHARATGHAQFSTGSDEEDQDEDWTEDSNSQSPNTTRRSSLTRGLHSSRAATPPPVVDHSAGARANLPDSPPESPVIVDSCEAEDETGEDVVGHYGSRHPARPPDADAITSRLLSRHSMQNLPPQITSISATSTPGTQTPPTYNNNDGHLHVQPSMPENGISRFLGASSSSGSATTALTHFASPVGPQLAHPRSPSPNTEAVRRAKSAGDLSSGFHPVVTPNLESGRHSPPSYTFSPAPHRRPGGNTQAKLDLWRTQVNVEPSHGPPAPLMKGAPEAMLGSDERRARLWEKAESEMGYLKQFRNPVIEGVRRMAAVRKRSKSRDDGEEGRGRHDSVLFSAGSRPPSRSGRSVRFEVAEGENGLGEDGEGNEESDRLEELLRRLWEGGGAVGNSAD